MKQMTIKEALEHAGIYTEEHELPYTHWTGTTPKGKQFTISVAAGAYGLQFTLFIEGMKGQISHCLFRTAVHKIKTN